MELTKCRPEKERILQDTEKRMETLFDRLSTKEIHPAVLSKTYKLVKCKFLLKRCS
jgi:hypothetical protein